MANVRNLEDNSLYINKWITGLVTQRSPLYTPLSLMGYQVLSRLDAFVDGLNMEISSLLTPIRRYGYSKYSTSQLSSGEIPQFFDTFKDLNGTIVNLVDTKTNVFTFTTTSHTQLFAKSTTVQGDSVTVGNAWYYCDGVDADTKKWVLGVLSKWGIVKPGSAPGVGTTSGSLSPLTGYKYVFVYKNPNTGHVSTASPTSDSTGPQTSVNFTLSGASSADPQVTNVEIYRTTDGGSFYYFLADVANGGTWSYTDSTADSGLNTDIIAPLVGNDPPPSGISLAVFHVGRVWVASGKDVYYGSGPDCVNGVPEEAFNAANVFHFPGKVTAILSTSVGLLVFTADNAYVIEGTTLTNFAPRPWQKNFGVANQNAVCQDGDTLFLYTTQGTCWQIDTALTEIGQQIRAKLAAFKNTNVYLTYHRNGDDEGLFIGDGTTNIYRYSLAFQHWSPVAQPVGGVGALASIETSTGNWSLMAGRATASGYLLKRDPSTYADDSGSYTCYVTVGSLVVAPPGRVEHIQSILLECMPASTYPTVAILHNEISGTFVPLPNPVPDPPLLPASQTISSKRHYLKSAATPLAESQTRHLQVKILFAAENTRAEIIGLGLGKPA